jgi:hypothetical protein
MTVTSLSPGNRREFATSSREQTNLDDELDSEDMLDVDNDAYFAHGATACVLTTEDIEGPGRGGD